MAKDYKGEKVLVVDRKDLFGNDNERYIDGFLPVTDPTEIINIMKEKGRFELREYAEENPDWKQIIPYNIMGQSFKARNPKFFLYQRLKKGKEARLHDLYSLGIGGHINPVDGKLDTLKTIKIGQQREIKEEVSCKFNKSELIGLINDDSNDVGKVHFGLVYLININGNIQVRETTRIKGSMEQLRTISTYNNKLESWSQLARAYLYTKFHNKTPVI